jgi:hypothetical protein
MAPAIVVTGSLIDTVQGGGLEFFGPFDSLELAIAYRDSVVKREVPEDKQHGMVFLAIELLKPNGTSAPKTTNVPPLNSDPAPKSVPVISRDPRVDSVP